MAKSNTRLELIWIGKENRPRLEPRILIEESEKSYHAKFRWDDLTADDEYVGSQVPLSLSSVLSISFSLTVDCGQTRLRAGKRQKARLCGSGARLFQDWAAGAELSGG